MGNHHSQIRQFMRNGFYDQYKLRLRMILRRQDHPVPMVKMFWLVVDSDSIESLVGLRGIDQRLSHHAAWSMSVTVPENGMPGLPHLPMIARYRADWQQKNRVAWPVKRVVPEAGISGLPHWLMTVLCKAGQRKRRHAAWSVRMTVPVVDILGSPHWQGSWNSQKP